MYKIFKLIALPVLAVGWLAHWLWMRKVIEAEKKQPKQVSKRLQQTRDEVSDYAQKLKEFKRPTHKPPDQDNQA